jgi:hypothetical protein
MPEVGDLPGHAAQRQPGPAGRRHVVHFQASGDEAASYVKGDVLSVDGGGTAI